MVAESTLGKIESYLETHKEAFEEQLKDLIRIPSISAQPAHNADTRRAAEFIKNDLQAIGLTTELIETKGHPLVYAESLKAPGTPTVLIYGHYDVQPPGLKTAGSLPLNVKILIEGEEEVGGANLEAFVAANSEKLRCDFAVISDTSQFAPGQPSILYGLRGLAYFELVVEGANTDLHSGTFGGTVANPLIALATILASLKDTDGRIQLDGFYDKVRPLTDRERAAFAALPFSDEAYQAKLGVNSLQGEIGYTTLERRGARPTCDVHGLYGGYQGEGPMTVLPRKAGAKVSFRLVPDQDPSLVSQQFHAHVKKVCPPGVTYKIIEYSAAPGIMFGFESPAVNAAVKAIEKGFGKAPVFVREGGSIPVVGLIKHALGVDTLLLGWGQDDDNLHGPNEKFSLADFHRGIKTSAYLLAYLAER